ncbi:hypothetical protein D3C86_1380550 [compost metagenome]
MPGIFRRLFDTGTTGQHDQVSQRDFFACGVELLLDAFEFAQHVAQLIRLVGLPEFLRCQTQAPTVGTAAFVGATEGRSGRPRGGDKLRNRQPGGQEFALQCGDIAVVDQLMIDLWNRVLPQQYFVGHFRAEVA